MFIDFIIYAFTGMFVGILAGLLGVGGGIVIVPILLIVLGLQGVSPDIIMHLALGTSAASIIFTGISSARAHHKRGAVEWYIVKRISLGILIGTYGGSLLASKMHSQHLQIFFATFLLYVAWQMLFGKTPEASRPMPKSLITNLVGVGIGFISSLVGVGGGTMSVPFMVWHNIEIRRAIATSSAIGIPIALGSATGYILNGLNVSTLPSFSLGFVYFPALIGIVIFSMLTAPIGAKLTHTWPVSTIKKCFALLLIVASMKMFFDGFN